MHQVNQCCQNENKSIEYETGKYKKDQKISFLRTLIAFVVISFFLILTIVIPLTNDLREKNNKEVHFIVDAKSVSVNQFLFKVVNIAEQFTSRTQIRKKLDLTFSK